MLGRHLGWWYVVLACALGVGCESGDDDATSSSGGATSTGGSNDRGGDSSAGSSTSAQGGAEHPSSGGRSGSGGSAQGGASAHSGGASSSAGKPGKCDIPECLRAVECVAECGGPVLSASCCACPAGQLDRDLQCGAGGAGGASSNDDVAAAGSVNLDDSLLDPAARGSGACASETVASLIASIHQANPDLADITRLYEPNLVGDGNQIYVFRAGEGFRFVFVRGSGDCPAGCIDHEYWYFETDAHCGIERVGHYTRQFSSSGNCFELIGTPLWGVPAASHDAGCGLDLDQLNSACVSDQCPAGLTAVFYYGFAGTAGPKLCSCSIPCGKDASVCPAGSQCSTISDGPGTVCSAL